MYYKFVPFAPADSDGFNTEDNIPYYVRQEIEGSQEIVLYKSTAEINRLNKDDYLERIGSIWGVFREDTSVTDMIVVIEYDKFIDFNYVYLPTFKRYYFVNDVKFINNKLYEIDLSVDVLMSYKDAIRGLNAFVDRNEFLYNKYIVDSKRAVEQGVDVEVITADNEIFDNTYAYSDLVYVINGYKTFATLNVT